MSPIVNIPGPGEKLRENYNLNQPWGGTLAPELVPVTIVDDFSDPYASGRGAWAYASVAALVGDPSVILFRAEQNQVRLRLKTIQIELDQFGQVQVGWVSGFSGMGQANTKRWKSPVKNVANRPSAQIWIGLAGVGVVSFAPFWNAVLQATDEPFDLKPDLTLEPSEHEGSSYGWAVCIKTVAVNIGLHVNLEWDELQLIG